MHSLSSCTAEHPNNVKTNFGSFGLVELKNADLAGPSDDEVKQFQLEFDSTGRPANCQVNNEFKYESNSKSNIQSNYKSNSKSNSKSNYQSNEHYYQPNDPSNDHSTTHNQSKEPHDDQSDNHPDYYQPGEQLDDHPNGPPISIRPTSNRLLITPVTYISLSQLNGPVSQYSETVKRKKF